MTIATTTSRINYSEDSIDVVGTEWHDDKVKLSLTSSARTVGNIDDAAISLDPTKDVVGSRVPENGPALTSTECTSPNRGHNLDTPATGNDLEMDATKVMNPQSSSIAESERESKNDHDDNSNQSRIKNSEDSIDVDGTEWHDDEVKLSLTSSARTVGNIDAATSLVPSKHVVGSHVPEDWAR
jgi:hypothetical protein